MSARQDGSPNPVTVRIIETVYVEAGTAADFKSVVQRLTGKDAAAELPEESSSRVMGQAGSLGDRKAAAGASTGEK
ncbi:hypothetical protein ZEAMMB73_Zm00001d009637 [Zea mays]|jgi:hypothetical protein|uniref:VQ domain-containing protein n=1 Tax=Zea mays TaxID=4577 RepID=A0A1D6FKV5_MAIZE|nr:hypothetical protein ZEAMMB73_Zm00001d009637 [Zea mays]